MIEDRYKAEAQRAADLFYTLLQAVEACGADTELTEIVMRLSDDHARIRRLFGLDPMQITRVIYPDDIYPLRDSTPTEKDDRGTLVEKVAEALEVFDTHGVMRLRAMAERAVDTILNAQAKNPEEGYLSPDERLKRYGKL